MTPFRLLSGLFCDGLTWFCIPLESFLRLSEVAVIVVTLLPLLTVAAAKALKALRGVPPL